MSKILFIGDPHIRHTHLTDGVKLLRWLEETISTLDPDLVVNLGDTFDTHSTIRAEVLCEVSKHVDIVCSSLKKEMVMVLGNHDMWKPNDYKYHALQVFKGRHKNLHIADDHICMDNISYVPYLHNNIWPKNTKSIAVTHNTFIGADYGYRTAQDGIHASDVHSDVVISGHIHKRQQLGKILYPGTPAATSASDTDQTKGILLFDTETYDQKFIQSPFPNWRSILFDVGCGQLGDVVNSHDHWVVTIRGPRAEVKALLASKEIKDIKASTSITFKTEILDSVKVDRVAIKSSNVYEMVDQYVDKVYSGAHDKETLKTAVKSALEVQI